MVKTKCVYSRIEKPRDGLRILAARFRGRGLRKSRCDIWMPNLGPSEKLLRGFHNQKLNWSEFSRRYRAKLFARFEPDASNVTIKNHGQKCTL